MDTLMAILEGLSTVIGILFLVFIPGFVISLVFYPRFSDLGLIRRLAFSVILSIGSSVASLVFLNIVTGADTAPGTISLGLGMVSALLLVVWLGELGYLKTSLPGLPSQISSRFQELLRFSPVTSSRHDQFAQTAMTRVVWQRTAQSGTNHVDHTYLIDVGDIIDIQLVDENRWKFSDGGLLPPPYPRTRNFELFVREFREAGSSLIDDLQLYPVLVDEKTRYHPPRSYPALRRPGD